MAKLPKFSPLWMKFPDYIFYPDSAKVKEMIGGRVDVPWIKNTCAIRLSRTLNENGIRLPYWKAMKTKKGADGRWYALTVRGLRRWLWHRLGKPQFDLKKKEGDPFDKTQLAAMRGIIGFDIKFSDATGHLDLWTGNSFSNEGKMSRNAWDASTRIWLWEAS